MKNKIMAIFLIIVMLLTINMTVNAEVIENSVMISNNDIIEVEQKVYSNATTEDDFADDSVIVVFKKSTSDYNRVFATKDFSEVKCKSITDITKYKRMLIADKKAEKVATLEKTRGLSAGKIEISDKEIIKEFNIDVENF